MFLLVICLLCLEIFFIFSSSFFVLTRIVLVSIFSQILAPLRFKTWNVFFIFFSLLIVCFKYKDRRGGVGIRIHCVVNYFGSASEFDTLGPEFSRLFFSFFFLGFLKKESHAQWRVCCWKNKIFKISITDF